MNQVERPRRLRRSGFIRDLVQDVHLRSSDLIWPAFIQPGRNQRKAIGTLPGCFRLSIDQLVHECQNLLPLGLRAVALFPALPDQQKDQKATEAVNPNGLVPEAIKELKKHFPQLVVISDVALDPYSSDGHDGLVKNGEVLNDETLLVLAEQAKIHADAGVDFVAPSDMMDGRVGWIRKTLDDNGHSRIGIISYTAKYASAFYGPFRDALDSAPRFGDKKTYQMNPFTSHEALREARLDMDEGADVLMVKPALSYLDVIKGIKAISDRPVAAYNVSGEYAMVKAAAAANAIDEKAAVMEILGSIKRAGADMIFSYHTPQVLEWLKQP